MCACFSHFTSTQDCRARQLEPQLQNGPLQFLHRQTQQGTPWSNPQQIFASDEAMGSSITNMASYLNGLQWLFSRRYHESSWRKFELPHIRLSGRSYRANKRTGDCRESLPSGKNGTECLTSRDIRSSRLGSGGFDGLDATEQCQNRTRCVHKASGRCRRQFSHSKPIPKSHRPLAGICQVRIYR
jgi:hypothetical protein